MPRLPGPPQGRAVLIRSLPDARLALQAAQESGAPAILLAPYAAGPLWLSEVAAAAARNWPDADFVATLDCGDMPGAALHALRAGVTCVRYAGPPSIFEKLQDIAEQSGACVVASLPPAFDPRRARDPLAACRAWLSGA